MDQRLAAFAKAMLDPRLPAPPGLVGPDGQPSAKRFSVYRNNVVLGLVETLGAAFPVTRRLVGDGFFGAMAQAYALSEPPASPVMLTYGAGFADFVGRFEPDVTPLYLKDIARLERAWTEAYHAAEALPLPPRALTEILAADLPRARLLLHPSTSVVRSAFPIVEIWRMHEESQDPRGLDLARAGQDALLIRPEAEVELRALPPGAAALIQALLAGAAIGEALAQGLADAPDFDLAGGLVGLVEANIIVGIGLPPARRPPTEVA